MEIYVSKESRGGDGTKEYPLNSLAQAAIIAKPGDEVIVAPGCTGNMLIRLSQACRKEELYTVLQ